MLYIHKLSSLNPKLVDLETVHLIRELREKVQYPLTTEKVQDYFLELFVSSTDRDVMEQGRMLIEPTIAGLQKIQAERDPVHEAINVQRAIQILSELPEALHKNMNFLDQISLWQENFLGEAVPVFNSIPRLRTQEEKIAGNKRVNEFFEMVLRNTAFNFNYGDIIHEAPLAHVQGLNEGMQKGFLFHVTLEEELKKINYEAIKRRTAPEKVQEMEQVRANVEIITKAVERAYQVNMRMVQWAVVMYAYVKWLMNK